MLLFRVLQLCHSDSSLLSFRVIASVIPSEARNLIFILRAGTRRKLECLQQEDIMFI
jgi:hypothetical protein